MVTATLNHYNSCVYELKLAGTAEPLRPTDRHPIFSETRQEWVRAVDLQPGERVKTASGVVGVENIARMPGMHRVYNLEVETDHRYFAGAAGVLSHNTGPGAGPGCPPTPGSGRATLGSSSTKNYRSTFHNAWPGRRGKVVVHHAVEQTVLDKYPGVISESEMHSLPNLRGIPNHMNNELHLSAIRRAWDKFYDTHPTATKQQLLDHASAIDDLVGSLFDPPIR